MAWGAAVAAAPLGTGGGEVKCSGGATPPGRATILGRKFVVVSSHLKILG